MSQSGSKSIIESTVSQSMSQSGSKSIIESISESGNESVRQ